MEHISYSEKDHIGLLTLNRPDTMNVLSVALLEEMAALLQEKRNNPPFVLIINAAGEKAFTAGASIAEMGALTRENAREHSECGNRVMGLLEVFPCPVIAAPHGYCLGGGMEMILACDIRVCAEKTTFAFPEVGIGISPGFGGIQRFARAVGLSKAKELIYTARRFKSAQALDMGLVSYVFPNETLLDKVFELAEEIAKNAPLAVRAVKEAINRGTGMPMQAAADMETDYFVSCVGTEDQKEAMSAFVEKRDHKPFVGR